MPKKVVTKKKKYQLSTKEIQISFFFTHQFLDIVLKYYFPAISCQYKFLTFNLHFKIHIIQLMGWSMPRGLLITSMRK